MSRVPEADWSDLSIAERLAATGAPTTCTAPDLKYSPHPIAADEMRSCLPNKIARDTDRAQLAPSSVPLDSRNFAASRDRAFRPAGPVISPVNCDSLKIPHNRLRS